jgi:hypothetical protein
VQRLRVGRQPQVVHQTCPRGEPVLPRHHQLGIRQRMPPRRGEAVALGMKLPYPGLTRVNAC